MFSNDNQRWSDLSVRFASAVILGPISLACLFYGGLAWFGFILGAGAGLAAEWAGLASHRIGSRPALLLLVGVVFAIAFSRGGLPAAVLILAGFTLLTGYFYGWFTAAGIPYAGLGGISLLWLRLQPGIGLWDTLFLVFIVWATDIGAYAVGRVVGGAKLAPRISPGKTRSGAIGGLAAACLFGGLLAGGGHGFALNAIPAALLLSVAAQAGDLLESAIKRRLGVKDSGSTIPGHGGLFDRLDGFLIAAPLAAVLAFFVHGGLPLWG
jgi:phosphatidate cytidylyltransferase